MATSEVVAVHGGAGNPSRRRMEDEPACHQALEAALEAGRSALDEGGSPLDAVEAAVLVLEDFPRFNAGRGSVLTDEGGVEMDAAVMSGDGLRAGAVAAVRGVRNPVAAARVVLDRSPHVLLAGEGADRFLRAHGVTEADELWLVSDRERRRWERSLEEEEATVEDDAAGTVGAVVRDRHGHLAAATSSGGSRGQAAGRVGDSPLVGAGTYADDATCAVSATGPGEALIRVAGAHEVAALMRHSGLSLAAACDSVLSEVGALGARAGLVAVDAAGNLAVPFTTAMMYRGWKVGEGRARTAIWPEGCGRTATR